MNILAIDTLAAPLSIAAQGSNGLVTQSFTGVGTSHAERLVTLIDTTISAAGFTADSIDMVLTPEGPGSFTGLRLGFAAAKALQLSSNCRFIPIPTLPCLASYYEMWNGNIATLIDAKRDRFYIQLFKNGTPITEVFDKTAADMLPYFSEKEPWLIAGYGTAAFKNAPAVINSGIPFQFLESDPLSFAHTMITYMQKNSSLLQEAADYAGPQYIRKSDAEKD
ncbi:MAG: tRNA (adenosine(37)-N6)-threonylcarbamoyltransferase complex dimerization subunit type 1 TsaB [Treponema sp.]|uniref:tRNA (adenosine(37)-N6)-threonylcarbamoyltransferase complex dimerization subunit type 1 TsaB n=1 Tax=Treponema sp. TaxID=166 RepID=UPI003FA33BC9